MYRKRLSVSHLEYGIFYLAGALIESSRDKISVNLGAKKEVMVGGGI